MTKPNISYENDTLEDETQNEIAGVNPTSNLSSGGAVSQISLSGLLNVIDGVAASEGRILVLTTNDVSQIDKALLRPGRIDHTINFQLASQADIAALFEQMYKVTETKGGVKSEKESQYTESQARIKELAASFSKKVPDGLLGQAEIQGFLMQYKKDPAAAVSNVDVWLEAKSKT